MLAPTDVPAWEPQDEAENCKLVAVQRGTDEWGRIHAQLQASLPGAQIVQVCSTLVLLANAEIFRAFIFPLAKSQGSPASASRDSYYGCRTSSWTLSTSSGRRGCS